MLRHTQGLQLPYIAAIVGFIVTYVAASFAYAELAPYPNYFQSRPALLGFLLFLISLSGAAIGFWLAH